MSSNKPSILSLAIGGDQEALSNLLALHCGEVRATLQGKIDKRWQAVLSEDDILQETFADAFLSIKQFRPQGKDAFVRWLVRLAKNNLLDAIRGLKTARRGGNRARVDTSRSDDSYLDLYEQLGATTTSPSRVAAREEAKLALDQAFDKMPQGYREVVGLYDLGECSVQEVCDACQCSPGAMFMRRARAHRMLAELLVGMSY